MTSDWLNGLTRLKSLTGRVLHGLVTNQDALRRAGWIGLALLIWVVVVSLPTPGGLSSEGHLAVALLLPVCVLFATEAISLPAIGLLIPVYQVVVGGMRADLVSNWMMSNALMFLMGTLMLVAAISSRGLDKLIALVILSNVGTSVYKVVFGIVSLSAFLAGFMSDAAAALMLAPVLGMVSILRDHTDQSLDNLTKLLIFSVGFGAVVGSPYTPAGGARNVIMMDYMNQLAGLDVSFYRWILYMFPYTVVMVGVLTAVLPLVFPPEITDLERAVASLKQEVRERPFGLKQMVILGVFLITIVLWLLVGDLFGIGIIAVGSAAVLLALGVVEWRHYQSDVDWGVLMIYLGAISLGGYTAETGAASWMANSFLGLIGGTGLAEGTGLVALVSFLVSGMTSAMSAGATTSVMGPIVLEISAQAGISPLIIGLATALVSSFGFMLIVSTPGNAIIYASGYLDVEDFLKAGFWVTLAAFVVFFVLLLIYWPLLG